MLRGAFNGVWDGDMVSVAKKSCALGYYSFGHEIGHNFGAYHNPGSPTNPKYSYGYAHLIQRGSSSNRRVGSFRLGNV